MSHGSNAGPRVAIVGGGLAGLAAAAALATEEFQVELFESRRRLGGRAASFRDPLTGELIDHCQHVAMGCCTNLDQFCRQTGVDGCIHRDATLNFIGPQGEDCRVRPAAWLPAPLHLLPTLMRLRYLDWRDRWQIARCVWRLARLQPLDDSQGPTMRVWLEAHGQSEAAIDLFWGVILVSALGESLDRVSVHAARKVFVDGFLASAAASVLCIPAVPLEELYGQKLLQWMAAHEVTVHLSTAVEKIVIGANLTAVITSEQRREFDYVIVAVPWRQVVDLFDADAKALLPSLELAAKLQAAPISAVHLWFDRPIMTRPHAVLVGRLSQWVFYHGSRKLDRPDRSSTQHEGAHYYQVVISASHDLIGRDRDAVVTQVVNELAAIWPQTNGARLLQSRLVTEPFSVFSVAPGAEMLRPGTNTTAPRLMLAGDWTATGWPATMEGAVRSGYLAAEAALAAEGRPRRLLAPDLPKGTLLRWLLPRDTRWPAS